MAKEPSLQAFAQILANAGSDLAVAKPGTIHDAANILHELGQELISAAEALGYASGGTGVILEVVKKKHGRGGVLEEVGVKKPEEVVEKNLEDFVEKK
jgi:hypothetical protein